jgi:uncharacterized membrane protein
MFILSAPCGGNKDGYGFAERRCKLFFHFSKRVKQAVVFIQEWKTDYDLNTNINNKIVMLTILIIIGMILLVVAFNLAQKGSYIAAILVFVICAVIFIITGIMQIREQRLWLGIFQFVASLGSIIGAIISVSMMNDDR